MFDNFAKYCLSNNASLKRMDIGSDDSAHLGVCNPSIFIDNGIPKLILRNVNYVLWHCNDDYRFNSPYGPLCYATKNDDFNLRTRNFICEPDGQFRLKNTLINMAFDTEPKWEFIGLEDARLVRWDGKLYITGVRRDTEENGQGRMELSEIDEYGNEVSRVRIKAPADDSSYCEKNWMPILDMPYHYVKWCNPLEIVQINPTSGDCETVLYKEYHGDIENIHFDGMDIRGSSQVINYGEYRIAIVHRCRLWMNEKNQKSGAHYYEQFIVWDADWNIVRISEPFNFGGFGIEFTNGLAVHEGRMLIPFALQDNFSFLLDVDAGVVMDFIFGKYRHTGSIDDNSVLGRFFKDTKNSYSCIDLAQDYYYEGHYAAAAVLSIRACEYNTFNTFDDLYEAVFICGKAFASIPGMDEFEKSLWLRMVDLFPTRSEGYLMLSKYYMYRGMSQESYTFAKLAYEKNFYKFNEGVLNETDGDIQYIRCLYNTENYLDCEKMAENLIHGKNISNEQFEELSSILEDIEKNKANKKRIL